MSTPAVCKSAFALVPTKDVGYELQIKFFDHQGKEVSVKKFPFGSPKPEESKAVDPFAELLDIYSQNGICEPDVLKHLFQKSDEQGVKNAVKVMSGSGFKGPTIVVLDLKHPKLGYTAASQEEIAKCEQAVCDFFKVKSGHAAASKHAKKIHAVLIPDFILCEGSLKVDLLKAGGFSAAEIDYFHTKEGAIALCQCVEFFMNGFKLGEQTPGFATSKYVVPITGKVFKPCLKSTVLYPALYKDVYAVDGVFGKTLSAVYPVSGGFDPKKKITTMSVTKKP